jgi:hypothetical protein
MSFVLNVRRFLNPGFHGGRAHIIARYGKPKPQRNTGYEYHDPEITLELSDCSRTVSFEFDLSTSKDRRAAIYKINLMADTINAFRDALLADVEPSIKREAAYREYLRESRRKRRKEVPEVIAKA